MDTIGRVGAKLCCALSDMDASTGSKQLPFFVGRYRCEEYLGGGMADVYRARDTELPRDVAIKILKPENQHDEEYRKAFLDEAQLASQCCYESIVSIFDKGEYDGCPYIVMEFLRGDNLATLIKRNAQGDLKRILRIALQIGRALESVHAQNIVHRDLKPQNLHVDRLGRVKLVDFGIAKSIEWNKTQTGMTKGTAYYMAPEQVLGQPVTFRTDMWAFGVVLFEMLTGGQRPFHGTSIDNLWVAIVNTGPDYQLLTSSAAPETVKKMVHRCLEKKPEKRYQSFHDICEELEAILETFYPGVTAKTETKSKIPDWREILQRVKGQPRIGAIAAASAGVLVVLALSFWVVTSRAHPNELKMHSGDMVLIPAGPALLGDEKRKANVAGFYVDKTEVSNKAYAEFVNTTGHQHPTDFREDKPDYPVVNVTFFDAQAFAKWAGKRLLTDDEWEKAARGTDGRLFPWGSQADPKLANLGNNPTLSKPELLPVNAFSEGATPLGVRNLCGNVWEWVDGVHAPKSEYVKAMQKDHLPVTIDDPFYSIRGGFYGQKLDPGLISDYSTFAGKLGSPVVGFRCARTVRSP